MTKADERALQDAESTLHHWTDQRDVKAAYGEPCEQEASKAEEARVNMMELIAKLLPGANPPETSRLFCLTSYAEASRRQADRQAGALKIISPRLGPEAQEHWDEIHTQRTVLWDLERNFILASCKEQGIHVDDSFTRKN